MNDTVKLLLVGATGLVGSEVLKLALAEPRIGSVIAPVRHKLDGHPKLSAPIVDFDALPQDAPWWRTDAAICTLGTTMRAAGTKQAFRRVDYEYPLAVARLAKTYGTPTFVLNSAVGADPDSRFFYNRVKGELERDLALVGFESLTFVRPGAISGHRNEFRLAERLLIVGLTLADPLLPERSRLNPASQIARALIESAIGAMPGENIVGPEALTGGKTASEA